jgi:hypothetical protein
MKHIQREGLVIENRQRFDEKPRINDSVIYFLLYILIMSILILVASERAIYLLVYLIESAIVLFVIAAFYSKLFGHNNPFFAALLTLFLVTIVLMAIIKNPNNAWRMSVYNNYTIFATQLDLTNSDIAKITFPVILKIQQIRTAFDVFNTDKRFEVTDNTFKPIEENETLPKNLVSDNTFKPIEENETLPKNLVSDDTFKPIEENETSNSDKESNESSDVLSDKCEQDKISIKTDTTFSGVQCIDGCEYTVVDVNRKDDDFFVVKLKFNNNLCKGEK